jgi:hypothetical protein
MIVAFMVPVPRVRTGNYRQGRASVYIIPRSNPLDMWAQTWWAQQLEPYQEDPELERERRRLDRERRKRAREAQEEAGERRGPSFKDVLDAFEERGRRELEQDLAALGLAPTEEEIQAAYRRKARECHPDHGGDADAMKQVNAAKERLRNRTSAKSPPPGEAGRSSPPPRSIGG